MLGIAGAAAAQSSREQQPAVRNARADALDTRCIVYTNTELKTSSITRNGLAWHAARNAP